MFVLFAQVHRLFEFECLQIRQITLFASADGQSKSWSIFPQNIHIHFFHAKLSTEIAVLVIAILLHNSAIPTQEGNDEAWRSGALHSLIIIRLTEHIQLNRWIIICNIFQEKISSLPQACYSGIKLINLVPQEAPEQKILLSRLFFQFSIADISNLIFNLVCVHHVWTSITASEMWFLCCQIHFENNTIEFPAALLLLAASPEAMCGVRVKATVIR